MILTEMSTQSLTADDIDEFTDLLLDTLYALSPYARDGLMPVRLNEKPASYEKYPRELFTLLETTRNVRDPEGGVRSAFATWRSGVLRKLDYLEVAPSAYAKLGELERWMIEHAPDLCARSTLQHLRRSMFGRIYAYLYPRLSLITEYANTCQQDDLLTEVVADGRRLRAVADRAFVQAHFNAATPTTQKQLAELLDAAQVKMLAEAAQEFLLGQQAYFEKVFRSKKEGNR